MQDPKLSRRRRFSVLSGATIGHMTGITPAIHASFGLLLIPLTREFGWSRTVVSVGLGLLSLVCMIGYPLVGRYADRRGAGRIATVGTVLFAVLLASGVLLTGSVWLFYALYLCLGVGATLVNPTLYLKMLSETHHRDMGFAAGFAGGIGVGVGYALVTLGGAVVLADFGWRAVYLAVAAFVLSLGLLARLRLLRTVGGPPAAIQAPGSEAPAAAGAGAGIGGSTYLLRSEFWLILLSLPLMAGLMMAITAHLVPIIIGHGVALRQAAQAVALCNLLLLPAQPICGLLVDRYELRLMVLPYLLCTLGLLMLLVVQQPLFIVPACVLFGIGVGTLFCVIPVTVQRCFGLGGFSTVMGLLYIGLFVGEGAGPVMLDMVFDRLGSYQPALVGAVLLTLAGAATFWVLARRPSAAEPLSHPVRAQPGQGALPTV